MSLQAVSTYKTKKVKFAVQDVAKQEFYKYQLEREFLFVTDAELSAKHNINVQQMALKWVELKEGDTVLRGVVVQDPQHPHRKLRVSSGLESLMTEKVHDASAQLRSEQATEVAECQRQGLSKHLRFSVEAIPSLEMVDAKVAEFKDSAKRAKMEKEIAETFPTEMEDSEPQAKHGVLGAPVAVKEEDDRDFEMDDEEEAESSLGCCHWQCGDQEEGQCQTKSQGQVQGHNEQAGRRLRVR